MGLQSFFREVAFGFDGCFASAGSGCDGLTIERIGHVAGCKYARHTGAGCHAFGDDVAGFVGLDPWAEQVAVGLMTDGQEEAVDGNVEVFLLGRAFLANEVCALHSGFTKEAHGVGLEEHFDLGIFEHAVLHGL